ncbi:MAG: 5-formyltetrahydrofolate cyclo-ligase [Zetaproteobacteria bacterium]|nr:MAG: 5-formyltetrahydrofolate cyclo-ligase [Zetaproteobacteria bacterium]
MKQALRELAIGQRMLMPRALRRHYSRLIIDRLRHEILEKRISHVMTLLTYIALPHEVDTHSILTWNGWRIFAPRMHGHERMDWHCIGPETSWKKSPWNILEPQNGPCWSPDDGGILICPLTAFDRQGNRLGMGKGCFDIWLGQHRSHLRAIIGLAYACQEVPSIPTEPHDVPMDFVITEKETIATCPN